MIVDDCGNENRIESCLFRSSCLPTAEKGEAICCFPFADADADGCLLLSIASGANDTAEFVASLLLVVRVENGYDAALP